MSGKVNSFSLFKEALGGDGAVRNEPRRSQGFGCLPPKFSWDAFLHYVVRRTGSVERKHAIGPFKQCNACLESERIGVNLAKATLK